VDDGSTCGQPFQDAAAVLVDPEDEPDDADVVEDDPFDDDPFDDDPFDDDPDDEPEPDESEEDDDVDSAFFPPEPLSLADEDPFGAFAVSRLSLR
jgi:hypothetical protein